uniref:Reverse transcriptase domain-containing protein n=1 Tax=Micrurus surinamensis TaxID=129470 RepID=A0A2D4PGE5_MICSU
MMELHKQLKDKRMAKHQIEWTTSRVILNFTKLFKYSMLEVFNELLSEAKVPNSWMEAYIMLIPKEDSDLQWIKNYRPISLLNVGYIIFASIIAEKLKIF